MGGKTKQFHANKFIHFLFKSVDLLSQRFPDLQMRKSWREFSFSFFQPMLLSPWNVVASFFGRSGCRRGCWVEVEVHELSGTSKRAVSLSYRREAQKPTENVYKGSLLTLSLFGPAGSAVGGSQPWRSSIIVHTHALALLLPQLHKFPSGAIIILFILRNQHVIKQ